MITNLISTLISKCTSCSVRNGHWTGHWTGQASNGLYLFQLLNSISDRELLNLINTLDQRGTLDKPDANGDYLIHCLSHWQRETDVCLKYILTLYRDLNYDLQRPDKNGRLAIHHICQRQGTEMCLMILDIYRLKKFNIAQSDRDGWQPIHLICRYQGEYLCQKILTIYRQNYWASVISQINLIPVRRLDIQSATNTNWLPIHLICRYQNSNVCARILNMYIEQGLEFRLAVTNNCGWQPIHYICCWQSGKFCRQVLDFYVKYGLDIHVATELNTCYPLTLICRWQNEETCRYILDIYDHLKLDFTIKDADGNQPIQIVKRWHDITTYLYFQYLYRRNGVPIPPLIISTIQVGQRLQFSG